MRTKRIEIRLTEEEFLELQKRASMRKMRMGGFMREASLHSIPPTIPSINQSLMPELAKIGNNLNQIAKKANESQKIEVTDLGAELASLRLFLIEVKK